MGLYTDFEIEITLKKNTPEHVINIIDYLFNWRRNDRKEKSELIKPNHEFFKTPRWHHIGSMSGWSDAESNFNPKTLHIKSISSLKNYDDEIDLFLDWIKPHLQCQDGDMIGTQWCECEESETVLIYTEGTAKEGAHVQTQGLPTVVNRQNKTGT